MENDNIKLCKVSMCDPVVETDTDSVVNKSPLLDGGDALKFIVEFGSDQCDITVSPGDNIDTDQIIGHIRNVDVKSRIKGKVTEVHRRWFAGEYDNSIQDIDTDTYLEPQENDSFNKLNELLERNQQAITFISQYILNFRFADLAANSLNISAFSSLEDVIERYDDASEEIMEEMGDNIKRICGSSNITSHCNNNDLFGLKSQIDNERERGFNNIIQQYNNIGGFGYTTGKISDFMLYSTYLDYITGDKFYYDDNNPYVVELFDAINNFLKIRSQLELNGTNIDGMIINFNSLCDNTLREYWTGNETDYYARMKEIFQYDFYTDDENDLIEAKINDEKRVTLYSKVLKYLQNLTSYTPPASDDEKYKGYDTESLLNMGTLPKSDIEKLNERLNDNLKKISIDFVTLRKIELDSDNPQFFSQYVSKGELDNIFSIKSTLESQGIDISEYSLITADPLLLANSLVLGRYLGVLKSVCDDESRILRRISDEAISWYTQNHEKIDNGSIFDEFKEASWSNKMPILRNTEKNDFYFIEEPKPIEELLNEQNDEYNYTEDSLLTKYGIDSYNYWLKYCAIATIANCMLPMYWSTGIPPTVGPTKLPIIFIPFTVISGRIIVVIGLGICGICPLPMIYFVNVSDYPGSIIIPMNRMVSALKQKSGALMTLKTEPIKDIASRMIKSNDDKINELNERIKQIDTDYLSISTSMKTDKETLRNIRKKRKEDSTSNKRKSEIG